MSLFEDVKKMLGSAVRSLNLIIEKRNLAQEEMNRKQYECNKNQVIYNHMIGMQNELADVLSKNTFSHVERITNPMQIRIIRYFQNSQALHFVYGLPATGLEDCRLNDSVLSSIQARVNSCIRQYTHQIQHNGTYQWYPFLMAGLFIEHITHSDTEIIITVRLIKRPFL